MRALRNNHGLGPGHSRAQAEAVDCKWRDSGERGRVFRIAAEKYTGLMMVPLPSPSSTSFGLRVLNLSRSLHKQVSVLKPQPPFLQLHLKFLQSFLKHKYMSVL